MKNSKIRRGALLGSAISLLLCFAMLLGTTFAWFTDSVSSESNKIVAGNLKVDLELKDKLSGTWASVKENKDPIFTHTNWEPGYVDAKILRVQNEGSLALKWKAKIYTAAHLTELADVIDVYVYDFGIVSDENAGTVAYPADRNLVAHNYVRIGTLAEYINSVEGIHFGTLEANETAYFGVAFKMQKSAGNDYQEMGLGGTFDIQILATQLASEEDSFGPEYDEESPYPIVPSYPVTTTEQLKNKLANALPGDEIFLAPGEFVLPASLEIPSGVTLLGAQAGVPASRWINNPAAEKTVIKYTGTAQTHMSDDVPEAVLSVYQTSVNEEYWFSDITIDGILIDGGNVAEAGIFFGKCEGEALENIKVINSAVLNCDIGIYLHGTYGAVVEHNYVKNVVDTGICLEGYNGYHYLTWAEVTAYVCNNVIENVTASANGAIALRTGMGDVVVSGNVIKNVTAYGSNGYSSITKASAITVDEVFESGEILIENNSIENADQGIAIYKYSASTVYDEWWWEGPQSNNDSVVVKDNCISEYKSFAIAVELVNDAGSSIKTTVEIAGNEIVSGVTANALVVDQSGNNWKVVASENSLNGSSANVNGTWEK